MTITPTPAQATERAYGRMAWGVNTSDPQANAAWKERMEHAALVLNRAADVFYAQAGHDLDSSYQAHPTHVVLAAVALALKMDGQGVHPVQDSFAWGDFSSGEEEMEALQDAVTSEEWQQIDDLAREMVAAKMLACNVTVAIANSDVPLVDMISGDTPGVLDRISGGEIEELARCASRTALRNVDLTKLCSSGVAA
jgi:hypothetical protein